MPAIKNFRERKMLKDILELRDQDGLVTYTYLENQIPKIVPGRTALAGKLTFFGATVGYGIPYATQYTNPQKAEWHTNVGYVSLPQADPNGLFSPASAEGTWILMKDPKGPSVKPIYIEPRCVVSPFKFEFDGPEQSNNYLSRKVRPKRPVLFSTGRFSIAIIYGGGPQIEVRAFKKH